MFLLWEAYPIHLPTPTSERCETLRYSLRKTLVALCVIALGTSCSNPPASNGGPSRAIAISVSSTVQDTDTNEYEAQLTQRILNHPQGWSAANITFVAGKNTPHSEIIRVHLVGSRDKLKESCGRKENSCSDIRKPGMCDIHIRIVQTPGATSMPSVWRINHEVAHCFDIADSQSGFMSPVEDRANDWPPEVPYLKGIRETKAPLIIHRAKSFQIANA